MVRKILSGGQTGVDRAALDVARALGVSVGGWCPAGRRAEDGAIDPVYPLRETPSDDYAERTAWNVRDAEATLVITHGPAEGGTALTVKCAAAQGKPCLVVNLLEGAEPDEVIQWIQREGITSLNVGGPRESQRPGISEMAVAFLDQVLPTVCGIGPSDTPPSKKG